MSEYPFAVSLPTARRLEESGDGLADDVVFSLSQFPRATAARINAARKNAREVLEENLDRTTDPWTDVETGERLELVRGAMIRGIPRVTIGDAHTLPPVARHQRMTLGTHARVDRESTRRARARRKAVAGERLAGPRRDEHETV